MSRTRFRVNPHSIVPWVWRNSLLETGRIPLEELCLMILKTDAKFEEKPIFCCKMTRIWWILIRALKSLKNLHFDWSLSCKLYNIRPKKVQRSYLSWYWRIMEIIWRKTDLWFGKWHEKFGKYSSEHCQICQKCQNSYFHGTLFCKVEMHELKIYRGVMCNDNEEWWKIWRGIDVSFQNWHEEFDEFWPEHSKISKICTLMGCFWPKYILFELKKCRGVTFVSTEYWYKIWRKTDLCFQKWHE